ncbi:695590b4-8ac1-4182-91f1-cd436e9fafe5 [Sclerotinia trifoliorum]|uniref:695590b4-8ac1-4182-91f1-cd436e9fafe5 n=1 Tax=Sclerotinia trifoliorum TaxID=28548 RepID=A0A8H2ZRT5_9HELO|nr:695590b4-8ac1-4182-91f1-cd436e9fafe5 [Sclerotinia trifoliorum]
MTSLKPRTIIIIGSGPLMSRSLSLYLASQNWQIILISRNHSSLLTYSHEINTLYPEAPKALIHTGDASIPSSLIEALDWATEQIGDKIDVLCYNAARVAPSPLLDLKPEILVKDFNVSATGTLVAGQWFLNHANKSYIPEGENPLFLVPGGLLDKYPDPNIAALCASKSASQCIVKMFEQVMEPVGILVGAPIVGGDVVEEGRMSPTSIVDGVFRPFFEERERGFSGREWVLERVWLPEGGYKRTRMSGKIGDGK